MATKLLASKATVEHRMYKFSSTEGSVWRFHVGFWSNFDWGYPVRFSGYLLVLVSAQEWKTEMLFCVTCSNAFQLRSDPEVIFTLPSWSSCRGQSVITPPPFHRVPPDYTENKTARRRGNKRNKLAVLWFLDLRIRHERAQCSGRCAFVSYAKLQSLFWHHFLRKMQYHA